MTSSKAGKTGWLAEMIGGSQGGKLVKSAQFSVFLEARSFRGCHILARPLPKGGVGFHVRSRLGISTFSRGGVFRCDPLECFHPRFHSPVEPRLALPFYGWREGRLARPSQAQIGSSV